MFGLGNAGHKKSSSSTWKGRRTGRDEKDALMDVLGFLWSAHKARQPNHEDQRKIFGFADYNSGYDGCVGICFRLLFWEGGGGKSK